MIRLLELDKARTVPIHRIVFAAIDIHRKLYERAVSCQKKTGSSEMHTLLSGGWADMHGVG